MGEWEGRGGRVEWEAAPRQAAKLCEELGLDSSSKGLEGPIRKETKESVTADDPEETEKREVTRYRALAATANYLAQDRVDIQFAAKEVCRDMSKPRASSWLK